jgi:hypothetical protein
MIVLTTEGEGVEVMARTRIYTDRASTFSDLTWDALEPPPYMMDLDGYRASNLIYGTPALIEHRTGGRQYGVGYSAYDAAKDFAALLRIEFLDLDTLPKRYERTEQRLWLQYHLDGRARLFAVVNNTWPAHALPKCVYWDGLSVLPAAWPQLRDLADAAGVDAFVIEMHDGQISRTDWRRLHSPISKAIRR